ncbi:MAG: HNH endonuclease [Oscillospiraceae bacterium]|nr:HNH endonuclease [Oscillospiraceae bacterium]
MIKLTKRPAPPQPITDENHYRSNPNFKALVDDCYGKCYICENDKATTLNVEHLVPHRGNDSLKYDWQNLFLSCGHCNNIKGDKYDNILDPTKLDPEEYISLSLTTNSFVENIIVCALSDDISTKQTVELLSHVYNGGTTDIKDIECTILRKEVTACVARFLKFVEGYRNEPNEDYDAIINKEISRDSAFAAFKRGIVRNDTDLFSKFSL